MLGGASSKGQSKGGRREEAYRLRKRSYFPDEIDEARLGDGAWWFAVQLPKIRVEARHLIVAQSMAGGEPPEEMTAPVAEE